MVVFNDSLVELWNTYKQLFFLLIVLLKRVILPEGNLQLSQFKRQNIGY
jgi:hypothetical protein